MDKIRSLKPRNLKPRNDRFVKAGNSAIKYNIYDQLFPNLLHVGLGESIKTHIVRDEKGIIH